MSAVRTQRACLAAVGLLVSLAVGCGRDERPAGTPGAGSDTRGVSAPSALSPAGEALAFARRVHAAADDELERGDHAAARSTLGTLLAPGALGALDADERRLLLQDTYFRLARLELQAKLPAAAERWASTGLALGRGPDLFTANLLVVRGQARETLGHDLEASADYHAALTINAALLEASLPVSSGSSGPGPSLGETAPAAAAPKSAAPTQSAPHQKEGP